MAKTAGKYMRFIYDEGGSGERKVALIAQNYAPALDEIEVTDSHTPGTSKEFLPGRENQPFTIEGYFRDELDDLERGVEKQIAIIVGKRKYSGTGILLTMEVTGRVEGAVTQSYTGKFNGIVMAVPYLFDEKSIAAFSIPEQTGPAAINATAHTVTLEVAAGTDLSALTAYFKLSPYATAKVGTTDQVSGVTENNFTAAVTYTVTAENGETQEWTVTVSAAS